MKGQLRTIKGSRRTTANQKERAFWPGITDDVIVDDIVALPMLTRGNRKQRRTNVNERKMKHNTRKQEEDKGKWKEEVGNRRTKENEHERK